MWLVLGGDASLVVGVVMVRVVILVPTATQILLVPMLLKTSKLFEALAGSAV